MKRFSCFLLSLLVLAATAAAQVPAIAFCKIDRDLDFKTAKAGDKVTLKLARDLYYAGQVVLPAGSLVNTTVVDAKDANSVSLVLESATSKAGKEIKLMGIIAAIATPKESLSDDPLYGMNHSTEVSQHTQPGSGGLDPQASVGTSGAAARTAILKGTNESNSNLTADSQGVNGISGLTLTWVLDKPPANHGAHIQEEELQAEIWNRDPVANGPTSSLTPLKSKRRTPLDIRLSSTEC